MFRTQLPSLGVEQHSATHMLGFALVYSLATLQHASGGPPRTVTGLNTEAIRVSTSSQQRLCQHSVGCKSLKILSFDTTKRSDLFQRSVN